jgi:nucleoside-diphosphate-sugar epimerase
MPKNHVLIAGASGVVGRAALEFFASESDWKSTALSRKRPDLDAVFDHLQIDLTDAKATRAAVAGLSNVTHLVYAALFEKPGLLAGWRERDQMDTNLLMLRNLMEPLDAIADLQHVTLLQGTKAYGAHIKPMRIPGKERDARVEHENFYWLQEDYLKEKQSGNAWAWTIFRPQIIFGHGPGAPMNLMSAIGVYGTLLKEHGEPLHYPGGPGAPTEAVDANLLAHAIGWATGASAARNETFNVTNGDVFTWPDIWPDIANALGMEAGEIRPASLTQMLPSESDHWREIVRKHNLVDHTIDSLVGDSRFYADALFATGRDAPAPPSLVSTIKIRQAGFTESIDTADMFAHWFAELQRLKILPPK